MTKFYRSRRWRQILLILASIYISAIWIWLALRLVWFDGIWWLSLLNTHAFYLVVPSLVLLPIAIYRGLRYRSSKLAIAGFALPFILFFDFFSYLLMSPDWQAQSIESKKDRIALRAMSFNLLFNNQSYSEIIRSIRTAKPDVTGLQVDSNRSRVFAI